jgi:hypothetical protein
VAEVWGGIFFEVKHEFLFGYFRNKYASFKSIRTETINVEASTNNRSDSKKAKLFITLQRHPDFFDNMKKFNEIREENEKTANKIQEDSKEQKTN